ncbi:T-cell immunoglobulin and mucin domain-containing protein 4-like isoform X1 [Phyllopteryx taeniolatus]|uniref:T-cell immunoglobulin and mucin domain-containing protein 4-like isoform X1 n=1 Tax=Phyllopteryx taeniolatus TaxID=161469 RepID=UPI002AD35A07|nr:T-cell immunoglobulin and mucin domain-containing protein 4-like isoform X1 [Phyllopteryx taeniolatus]
MKMTTRFSTLLLCCLLLTVCESGASPVVGIMGQHVTLTCTYDVVKHGPLSACWSRGYLPLLGCGNQIISTNGSSVRANSRRYKLLGRLEAGNISLTILDAKKEDAGEYGCRVMINGIFNDKKYHIKLIIKDAPQTTTLKTDMSTDRVAAGSTAAQRTSSVGLQNSSSSNIKTKNEHGSVPMSMVVMGVLFGFILFVTIAVVIGVISKRRRRLTKIHQQQPSVPSVRFSSLSSALHLQHQAAVVENIYQMAGDEYDYLP